MTLRARVLPAKHGKQLTACPIQLRQVQRAGANLSARAKMRQFLVYVPPHPLVKHWLAVARNAQTPPAIFKSAIAELSRILLYECVRDILPTVEAQIETPMGVAADVEYVDPTKPIAVVPVLRAGLAMLEEASTIIPVASTYHVGYARDERTLEAAPYLNKLPERFDMDSKVIVVDIMLATGGTVCKVLDDIIARGAVPENIRVVSVLSASPALSKMSERYEGMKVYTAMIDAEVNEQGFIIPGLGDAGDRCYGTL